MFSLKRIGVSFAIGFIISLVAGSVGGVDFASLILRAMLSGLFFAVVVSGAMVLYQKFLLNGESPFDTSQQDDTIVRPGSNVDITLDDDDLPDNASAPNFSLGETVVPDSNGVQQDVIPSRQANDSFRPSELNTVAASDFSQAVEKKPDDSLRETLREGVSAEKIASRDEKNQSVADMELDILPEIEDIVDNDKGIVSDDDQVIQDTVFAETGETKPIAPAGFSDMGDARDLAAAIRTALAKDT